jgi:hypothetical protein
VKERPLTLHLFLSLSQVHPMRVLWEALPPERAPSFSSATGALSRAPSVTSVSGVRVSGLLPADTRASCRWEAEEGEEEEEEEGLEVIQLSPPRTPPRATAASTRDLQVTPALDSLPTLIHVYGVAHGGTHTPKRLQELRFSAKDPL